MDGFPATDQYNAIVSAGRGFASLFHYEDDGESLVRSLVRIYIKLKRQYRSISEEDFLDIYPDALYRGVAKQIKRKSIKHPPAYMYRAVSNASQDFLDARNRHAKYVAANGHVADGFESLHKYDACQEIEIKEEVWKHLQTLDSTNRAIMDLHIRGNTFARISEILGIPKSTANKRYLESIELLRNRVAGQLG